MKSWITREKYILPSGKKQWRFFFKGNVSIVIEYNENYDDFEKWFIFIDRYSLFDISNELMYIEFAFGKTRKEAFKTFRKALLAH